MSKGQQFYTPNAASHPGKPAGMYSVADVRRMEEERKAFVAVEAKRVIERQKDAEDNARTAQKDAAQRYRDEQGQARIEALRARLAASWPGDSASFERAVDAGMLDRALENEALAAVDAIAEDARQFMRGKF